ncbi:ABC transporter ATP-binding protein/permease [Microlunatus parietis]|uniref:ABC-type transport system involved in cytochrome bd biosynthesis fused ATPase/permease subunit n=1 Tax=Microlunatus parietis TaxID=682979 RepID=A0A7Y9I688_9ACTN|nr:ABC transporter ATP-binding protein [Microlunatus parietis]NYE71058.1 ABC-type transport system involved in cytochrome bd biosynthesis fused ATPase/permease subunit [Microlunatus parietis]
MGTEPPTVSAMLRLATGARRWIVLSTGLSLIITATYVGQGIAFALALLRILQGGAWADVLGLLLTAVAMVIIRAGVTWLRESVGVTAAARIKAALRRRAFAVLFALGPGYTTGARAGAVQTMVIDGIERLEAYFSKFVSQLLVSVLGAAAILLGLTMIDPVVGVILTAAALAIATTPLLARRLQAERSSGYWAEWRRLGADHLDLLQAMTTLKLFGAAAPRRAALAQRSWHFYRASLSFVAVANLRTGAMGLLSSGGAAVAIAVGVVRVADGALSAFGLLLVLLLAREAFRPLEELQKAYHSAYPAVAAGRAIQGFLAEQPTVKAPDPELAAAAGRRVRGEAIELRRVTFGYRPHLPVLRDVSLTVPEGHTVAIVGRSGAGKSTVVSLIQRFLDPDSGTLTLGGVDLRELSPAYLRSRIAVVAQDTYLFHGTLRDNLLLGRPDAGAGRLDAALHTAGATDLLARLPDGYDSIIGERGSTLSGGERQRIAIARAVLTEAPVLLLDEATSSLDSATEAGVQSALDTLARGRTTLVVAHRLSTVRWADSIIVLDNGSVVESGSHDELVARGGSYASLLEAQRFDAGPFDAHAATAERVPR